MAPEWAPCIFEEKMMQHSISIQGITKKYGSITVLDGINLEINDGELLCLLGPSGCGKTTLLRIIAGLESQDSGKVTIFGKDTEGMSAAARNFGIVFQSYALFPNLNVFENIAYGLRNREYKKSEIASRVKTLLSLINLSDAAKKYPSQLSGGEQQRVALARALAVKPDFLLLDEPLSALDAKVRVKLRREIRRIQRELGLTTILVTHDQEEALTMADRIVVMDKAKIMQSGLPREIYQKPVNRFVADFIGSINFIPHQDRIIAVRPENILVTLDSGEGSIPARLSDLEFRGSFCRASANLKNDMRNTEIIIDLPYHEAIRLDLSDDKDIYVNFRDDRYLYFSA